MYVCSAMAVCNFVIFVIQVKLNGINVCAEVANKKDTLISVNNFLIRNNMHTRLEN